MSEATYMYNELLCDKLRESAFSIIGMLEKESILLLESKVSMSLGIQLTLKELVRMSDYPKQLSDIIDDFLMPEYESKNNKK